MQTDQNSIIRDADTTVTLDHTTFHIRRDYNPNQTAVSAFCNQIQIVLRGEKAKTPKSAMVRNGD